MQSGTLPAVDFGAEWTGHAAVDGGEEAESAQPDARGLPVEGQPSGATAAVTAAMPAVQSDLSQFAHRRRRVFEGRTLPGSDEGDGAPGQSSADAARVPAMPGGLRPMPGETVPGDRGVGDGSPDASREHTDAVEIGRAHV